MLPPYAPVTDAQVVAETANRMTVFAVATDKVPAAALIVLPDFGYTVIVCPESLRIPIIAPISVGGKMTPVPEELVVMVLKTADSCRASAMVLPTATSPVVPSPQILSVAKPELPEAKTLEGIAIFIAPFVCKKLHLLNHAVRTLKSNQTIFPATTHTEKPINVTAG